jgi:hypothetical protein
VDIYLKYIPPSWASISNLEIAQTALNISKYIGLLIDIFNGKAVKIIFFAVANPEAVYPLRALIYEIAFEGGLIFAGVNAAVAAAAYLYAMVKRRDGLAQAASMAVGAS